MVIVQNEYFSAQQICMSGQCFRMEMCTDNKYRLIASGKYLEISQREDEIAFDCTQEEYDGIWHDYFDMETDYSRIIGSIDQEDLYLMRS